MSDTTVVQAPVSFTIGETAVLPNFDNNNDNVLAAQNAALGQSATIQSLSFYVTSAAGNLRLGIYDATGPSGGPGSLKAQTNSFTPTTGWNTRNVTTPVMLNAGTYWLAYLPSSNALAFRRKDTTGTSGRYYSKTFGALPTTFSTSPRYTASHWSMYANLTGAVDVTSPSMPTNLAASAVSSSQINLSWTASSDNVGVAGYKVFRGGIQVGSPAGTTYSDAGLTASTSYSYTVSAYDAAGNNSAQSASASATTQANPVTSPDGSTATPGSGTIIDSSLNTWTVTSGGVINKNGAAAGYSANVVLLLWYNNTIYQENNAGGWWSWNGTGWADSAGDPRSGVDTTQPSTPTSLSASAVSPSQIDLTWTASTDNVGVTGYRVFRGSSQVGSPTGTTYSDIGLAASTQYSYTVRAVDAAGNVSGISNTATATTQAGADTTAPSAPTNLSTAVVSSSQINLSWAASTDNIGVTGYRVFRGATQVGSPTGTTYSDIGLAASTAYSYTVKAIDAAGNLSAASNAASATTQAEGETGYQFPNITKTPSSRTLSGTATFASIGLYWKAANGSSSRVALMRYRAVGTSLWKQAYSMSFDARTSHAGPYGGSSTENALEYRGSIVGLSSNTQYEIEAMVDTNGELASATIRTWSETFPVSNTITLPTSSGSQLNITQSGTAQGYVVYAPAGGGSATIDVANGAQYDININASYIIIRGLTLRGAQIHGIHIGANSHDVVIEDCDISGWGRIAGDGWGVELDSGIGGDMFTDTPNVKRIIVQRNRIHHPRSNSNSWRQARPSYGGDTHPNGPSAISFWGSGGQHVFRYNEIYSDSTHYFNDAITGGENFSIHGAPGPDTDIYGNKIANCWDEALEMDGGGRNVRIWGNFLDMTFNGVSTTPVNIGPLYFFRNVCHRTQYAASDSLTSGRFAKAPNEGGTGGRAYFFHNTIYQNAGGGSKEGIWGGAPNYTVFNNSLRATDYSFNPRGSGSSSDYNLLIGSQTEAHSFKVNPVYDPGHSSGPYTLQAGSPGQDQGVILPNFSDGFFGAAPDMGAQERGAPALVFGIQ